MKKIIAVFASTLLTAACGGNYLNLVRQDLEQQRQPKSYIDGYVNGCESGNSATNSLYTFTKNPARFDTDLLYRQGWDNGFKVCQAHSAG